MLKFKRDNRVSGTYWAESERFQLRILKEKYEGKVHWLLDVRELTDTAGVRHAVGQPVIARTDCEKLAEAKRVAARFVELAEDTSTYGLESVLSRAATQIVEEDIAEIQASPEYQRAMARLNAN